MDFRLQIISDALPWCFVSKQKCGYIFFNVDFFVRKALTNQALLISNL